MAVFFKTNALEMIPSWGIFNVFIYFFPLFRWIFIFFVNFFQFRKSLSQKRSISILVSNNNLEFIVDKHMFLKISRHGKSLLSLV